jgi:SsrA-binding protein
VWTWSPHRDGHADATGGARQAGAIGRRRYAPTVAKGKGKRKVGAGDVASNRYASHRYELIERLEAGIVLEGTEVKALRTSGAQLKDGYASIRDHELWLHSVHIPPYGPASRENHEPERPRKLLLHRRELDRIAARAQERGLTLVPTRVYFSGAHAKVEIALARGKDLYDKRQSIRERETRRDIERGMREAGR